MTDQNIQPQKDAAFSFNILMELEAILGRDQTFEVTCHDYLQQLMGTFLVPKGALLLLDPVENLLYLKSGSGLSFDRIELRMDRDVFHALLTEESPLVHIDQPAEPLVPFFKSKERVLKSMEAELWVTLRLKNSVVGVILLSPKWRESVFDDNDLKILQIAANMLANAIHNHTLLEQLRHLNEDQISRSHVSEMRDALSIAPQNFLTMKALTDEILRQSLKILNGISGAVFLTQPHNPLLKISSAIGIDARDLQAIHLSKNLKVISQSFRKTAPVVVQKTEDRKLEQLFAEGEVIVGPLMIKDQPVGIIMIAKNQTLENDAAFAEDDIKALDAIARQAGFAIDNFLRFQNLTAENRSLKDIHDRMSGGLIELSQIGEVVLCNAAFAEMSQWDEEKLVGSHYNLLFRNESVVLNLIQQVLSSGSRAMEQSVILTSFPQAPVVNISVSPIENEENVVRGLVLTFEELPADARKKELFRGKVEPSSLSEIIYGPHQPNLKGEDLRITVMVLRVANLFELCKTFEAAELTGIINQLLSGIRKAVFAEGGSVDRSDPSESICLFGWPLVRGNPASHAANSYQQIRNDVTETDIVKTPIKISAGISSGRIVAAGGQQNSAGDLVVFGEALQIARHLCLQAESGKCLVSDGVYQELKDAYPFSRHKKSRIKGWSGSTQTWQLR